MVNYVSMFFQHLALSQLSENEIEKTWQRIQVWQRSVLIKKITQKILQRILDHFFAGPCCKVGRVWIGRDARGLAEVWVQLQIQLLQAAWWEKEQGQLDTLAPGYDVLLDCHMRPHLLEVNSRPSIYTESVDLAVNAPLVRELFSLVGFHLPSCGMSQSTLKVAMLREEIEPFISKYTGVVQKIQTQPGDGGAVNVFWRIVHTRSLQRGESQKTKWCAD